MKKIVVIVMFVIYSIFSSFLIGSATASSDFVEWEQIFGDSNQIEKGMMVIQTNDNGYLVLSDTIFHNGYGFQSDIWLVKTDSKGDMDWNLTFERPDNFYTRSGKYVEQTKDNGYLVITQAQNYGYGEWQYTWMIKLDINGNIVWDLALPRIDFSSGIQLSDEGYLIAGTDASSFYPNCFKIDKNGVKEWGYEYSLRTEITSVWENVEGKFFMTTRTGNLIQLYENGTINWKKSFCDENLLIEGETSDGDLFLIGSKKIPAGNYNVVFFTCDSDGYILINKTIGHYDRSELILWNWSIAADGLQFERYPPRFNIEQDNRGGYLFIIRRGLTYPVIRENNYLCPLWIVKTDDYGNYEWRGVLEDVPVESVQQTKDAGFILVGMKSEDIWLMKIQEDIQIYSNPPTVHIISPADGEIVSGILTIQGIADDAQDSLEFVQIKIIQGTSWKTVNGTSEWSYTWDTTRLPDFGNGNIVIYARSYNGNDYSIIDSVMVTINQSVQQDQEQTTVNKETPGFEILFLLISLTAILFWKKT